jgi:hypothetical protein
MKRNGFCSQICQLIQLLTISFVAIAGSILLVSAPSLAAPSKSLEINVYRDPSCSCCGGWIEHLAGQGFQTKEITTPDVEKIKQQYGVPDTLASCHTAVIDRYIVEGHVPVEDIKRLLVEQPNVTGIAVPGMPIGTPGMEDGDQRDSFTVFSFDKQGNAAAFNRYSY